MVRRLKTFTVQLTVLCDLDFRHTVSKLKNIRQNLYSGISLILANLSYIAIINYHTFSV